jgi:hypothetical protein
MFRYSLTTLNLNRTPRPPSRSAETLSGYRPDIEFGISQIEALRRVILGLHHSLDQDRSVDLPGGASDAARSQSQGERRLRLGRPPLAVRAPAVAPAARGLASSAMMVMMVVVMVMMVVVMPVARRMRRGGERGHGHGEAEGESGDQFLRHCDLLRDGS